MKWKLILSILILIISVPSLAKKNNGIIDTMIYGKRFYVSAIDENRLRLSWGNNVREINSSSGIFTNDIGKRNVLYKYSKHNIVPIYSYLYMIDSNNAYVVLPLNDSKICLLGFRKLPDSILIYHNNISNNPEIVSFEAPSLLIIEKGSKYFQFIVGEKAKYLEYGDTSSIKYSNITLINSYCCGGLYLSMSYAIYLDNKVDIFLDDKLFYKTITDNKKIINPIYYNLIDD